MLDNCLEHIIFWYHNNLDSCNKTNGKKTIIS